MSTAARPPERSIRSALRPDLRAELLEAMRDLERKLHRLRRRLAAPRPQRDLVSEIERALEQKPALTTPEVAQAITARESVVRAVLKQHPERFSVRTGVAGRSPQARCWILTRRASSTQPEDSAEPPEVNRA